MQQIRRLATLLIALLPATVAAQANPWVDIQTVSSEQPLEIRLSGWVDTDTFYGGMLYNNGSTNVLDFYDLTASGTGVTVAGSSLSLDTGDIFALGDWCIGNNFVLLPYINDFDVRAIRVDNTGTPTVIDIPGTDITNFTTTDCFTTNAAADFWIGTLDFDNGRTSLFRSTDEGANWNLEFNYNPAGETIIGPFSGGFRTRFGALNDARIGLSYQLGSGSLHATALEPDGSLFYDVDFDGFSPHSGFIGNGFLKECDGRQYGGNAWGICSGGTRVGISYIDLTTGGPDFRLGNTVVANDYSFQGLGLGFSQDRQDTHAHAFSNRHVRARIGGGNLILESVSDYPFRDIGGPVDATENDTRIYVGGGWRPQRGDGTPQFTIATLDPTLVVGQPLGDPTAAVPALNRTAVLILFGVMALIGIVAARRRMF